MQRGNVPGGSGLASQEMEMTSAPVLLLFCGEGRVGSREAAYPDEKYMVRSSELGEERARGKAREDTRQDGREGQSRWQRA